MAGDVVKVLTSSARQRLDLPDQVKIQIGDPP